MNALKFSLLAMFFWLLSSVASHAQQLIETEKGYLVPVSVYNGDTIPHIRMNTLWVYPREKFKSKKERARYDRLVYDVKKTLPIAKLVKQEIKLTAKELTALQSKKEKKRFLNEKEKELKTKYTPMLKKLSLSQGKLLIRLIDRECNHTSYELVKLFMGSFKAVFYQTFATMLGASLKKEYHAETDDLMVERVINMVESGQI